ncbi:MAG: LCP family protein [Candidatus Margulisiibacteriota bacterium]
MRRKRPDWLRLLALLTLFCGIAYFYANIFAPRLIPRFLRIGVTRRPTNILVLGTDITFDGRSGEPIMQTNGRTDTILLLHVDPVRYRIDLVSIPRDSFVEIAGYGWQKINAANVFGGTELIKSTVERLTGVNIDYYLKVNTFAAVKLVDLLGGIDVTIDKDMYYVDRAQNLYINLKKGEHKLSGKEAEGFIRFRHDALGDIGRIGRQQQFMEILFHSFTKPQNLVKAPVGFTLAMRYVQTDLPLLKTIRLANFARMISLREIHSFTPTAESASDPGAGAILLLDKRGLQQYIRANF